MPVGFSDDMMGGDLEVDTSVGQGKFIDGILPRDRRGSGQHDSYIWSFLRAEVVDASHPKNFRRYSASCSSVIFVSDIFLAWFHVDPILGFSLSSFDLKLSLFRQISRPNAGEDMSQACIHFRILHRHSLFPLEAYR